MEQEVKPFKEFEEEAIISLFLDFPDLFTSVSNFIKPEIFNKIEARYVISAIKDDYDKYKIIPSRNLLYDRLAKVLTVDDPYKEILGLVRRKSDPREVPIIKDTIISWAKHKTYELLYTDEAIASYHRGEYGPIQQIVDSASKITDATSSGFWLFDQVDELFVDRAVEHYSTGFPQLDKNLNNGGPSPKEVLIWMAPTGVGKSLILGNNAVASARNGLNVLVVTFELQTILLASRLCGALTRTEINKFFTPTNGLSQSKISELRVEQDKVRSKFRNFKSTYGEIVIYELPPDECCANDVLGIVENLNRHKAWVPNVIILDYLELMVSNHSRRGDDEYEKQKGVATQIRGLASKTGTLIYTATQTNRSAIKETNDRGRTDGDNFIDLDKSAESYGKNMPVDYVISVNQTRDEYANGTARFFVAKNRNGPKYISITAHIDYKSMTAFEVPR